MITRVTTPLDAPRYPAQALARLYGVHWLVETNLKHRKQTLRMDLLRSASVEGVWKELTLFVLVYNLGRRVRRAAGKQQGVPTERISFIDAWRWQRPAQPGEGLPALVVNPYRPDRHEPRGRKRRPKEFPGGKRPREQLRKALRKKGVAA